MHLQKSQKEMEEEYRIEIHHFLYEIERNPLGVIIHCIEIIAKEQNTLNQESNLQCFSSYESNDDSQELYSNSEEEYEDYLSEKTYEQEGFF